MEPYLKLRRKLAEQVQQSEDTNSDPIVHQDAITDMGDLFDDDEFINKSETNEIPADEKGEEDMEITASPEKEVTVGKKTNRN